MRISLPGYARLTSPRASGIVLESCRSAFESILAHETLYDFAARQPDARKFPGRATVYAVELPDGCGNGVVRRSMRGGALARLNTDLFLPPTRGFRELLTSLRLRLAGVATPEVIGFAVYAAGPVFRRSDVVTREVTGRDLGSVLAAGVNDERRRVLLDAVATLVASLAKAGAHHPDLNLRNVLVTGAGADPAFPAPGYPLPVTEAVRAYVLDVDRIRFHVPGDPIVLRANIERLERSLRKRRELEGLAISEPDIASLRARVMELAQ